MNRVVTRVVIATGGTWCDGDHHFIEQDDFIIGVDGGNVELLDRNIWPDLAVGDFDTAPPERLDVLRSRGVRIEQLPRDKDMTDTEFAVVKALEHQPEEVLLLGAWGNRWDHTLGSISMLGKVLQSGTRAVMQNRWNRMQLVEPGSLSVRKSDYHYLSLVAWSGVVKGISLSGFRFPLDDGTLERASSLAISNEWSAEVGTVRHKEGRLLVIQSRDP